MADAGVAYPMLLRRRRRWRPRARHLRLAAVLFVGAALALAAAIYLTRPAPPSAHALLVASLRSLNAGNYHAARAQAQQAAAADPRAGVGQAVLARAFLELDDGVAAEGALARATAAGLPANRTHQLLAHARLLQIDSEGALAEAAKAAPRYADYARRIAARALATSGRTVESKAALESLIAAAPEDGAAWADLGRLRLTNGDVGGASIAAGRAVRLRPGDPRVLTLAGEVVRARYGLLAALPWFDAALKRDALFYPALIEQAATLGEAGRNADMLVSLRRAMQARPGSPQPLYLQAVLAARAGKLDLAASLADRAGGAPGAVLLNGTIDYAAGRYEQAVARWRELQATQPMNVELRRWLAAALLRSGDSAGALAVLRPWVIRGDADAYALTLAARALEMTGDRGGAGRLLDRAAGTSRAPAAAFTSDTGLATLTAGVASTPTDPTYVLGVIRGQLDRGDVGGAIGRARALTLASPGAPDAQLAYGDALAVAGRNPIAAYARAADLRFDEPTMLRLVDAQARAGRQRDAAATLALFIGQNPQNLTAQRLLGQAQVQAGDWEAAIETLEGVRGRVGNGEANLLAALALAYAGDGEGEVAVRYARAAYALQPMSMGVCDAYGIALAAAGRVGEARQLLDKAVALAPRDPIIAGHRRKLG